MPSADADDAASASLDAAAFTSIDWAAESSGRRRPTGRTLGFALALAALVALLAYDLLAAPDELFPMLDWDVTRMDWLVLASLTVLGRYTVVPLVADRERTLPHVRAFVRRPSGVASLAVVLVFAVLGVLSVEVFEFTYAKLDHRLQPPVFASLDVAVTDGYSCVGPVVNGACRGTWQYPLGTDRIGENVIELLLGGVYVAFKVTVAAAVLMAVVATAVGTTAGYVGGRVDAVLMRYVDVQQTVPAVIVYIVLATLLFGNVEGISDGGMFTFALVFGLLDWGGIARLVRSEAMRQRSAGYVRAAKAAGATDRHVIRRHVVPNATATIVTAVTRRVPLLILAHVGLAYLELFGSRPTSLGSVLRLGLRSRHVPWHAKWWTTAFAALTVVALVVAFNVFGDTVRDVLDPHEEVR